MSAVCPLCEGTSWRPVEGEGLRRVVRCDCVAGANTASALERACVPLRYRDCAFDERSGGKPFDQLNNNLVQAFSVAERWAEAFPDLEAGLLFSGAPGVGKTHLAVAILRRVILERRIAIAALFSDFRSLLREIRDSYSPETRATEMQVLRPVLDAELLVLDDLGGESSTLWVFDTLFYILNHRYNQKKLTVITTNFTDQVSSGRLPPGSSPRARGASRVDETLSERITARLRSRLYEMCQDVRLEGNDYREQTLQANFKAHLRARVERS